jgi:hypothetical protein
MSSVVIGRLQQQPGSSSQEQRSSSSLLRFMSFYDFLTKFEYKRTLYGELYSGTARFLDIGRLILCAKRIRFGFLSLGG